MTNFNPIAGIKAALAPTSKVLTPKAGQAAPVARPAGDSLAVGQHAAPPVGQAELQRAQILLADAIGDNQRAIADLKAAKADARTAQEEIKIDAALARLERDGAKLAAFGRLTTRLANNPNATDQERLQLAEHVRRGCELSSPEDAGRCLVNAEDVVRNVGRTPRSDEGLLEVTQAVQLRASQIENLMQSREAKLQKADTSEEMQKLQIELAELKMELGVVQDLKLQCDKIANRQGATPAEVDAFKAQATDMLSGTSLQAMRVAGTTLEYMARNAGRPEGEQSDLGLHNATVGLANRLGQVEDQIYQLTADTKQVRSSEELQKVQIKLADLYRDRDTLVALKVQADRVAHLDEPGDLGRLKEILQAAQSTDQPSTLMALLAEATQIGR